jgi:hypothetical protein
LFCWNRYYQNVDGSRLVSPTTTQSSCAEQGGGIDCDFSYENFGLPTVVSGFGSDGPSVSLSLSLSLSLSD